MALSSIIISIITFCYAHATINPCDPANYQTISDIRRRTDYEVNKGYLCDYGLIRDDEWYRFKSVAGNMMATRNPGIRHCGTYVPIWFNAKHPEKENVTENAKACAAVPFIPPSGCGISYDIKVVKCPGNFYVYRLKEPKQCSFAYCAGESLPEEAPCSYTGDSLPICPGVIPIVTATAGIKEESSINVSLRCFWKSPGNLTYVEYEARWFNDEKDQQPKIHASFNGTDEAEFLFRPAQMDKANGYEFQKNVFCQVRARYKSGNWSRWQSSNRIFTGISVFPTVIPRLNDCGTQSREVVVTLRPHLPIREKAVRIDVFSPRTSLIDEICVVGEKKDFTHCGIVFPKDHEVGKPLRFKLLTTCATGDNEEEFNTSYSLNYNFGGVVNSFWVPHKFPKINITRTKFKIQECISSGDPHFKTFDGNKYDFFGRGTFLLYRNKFSGTEIQVRQRACGTRPSCNCGVAIRENVFFRIYDLCSQSGGKWWEEGVQTRMYTRFAKDFKLSRFYTTATPRGSATTYEVHLPSGIIVIGKRYSWGFNIHVKAPVYPGHPSEGLCGNNNRDRNDYFTKWRTKDEFGEYWRIRTRKTAFDFESKEYDDGDVRSSCNKTICVCTRGSSSGLCGKDAQDKVCFKSLTATEKHRDAFGLSCENGKRKKRALLPEDDSIDDQDEIPPFNPAEVNISSPLTWPTPSGLTEANVKRFCENKLRYSKAGKACATVDGVDIDGLVKNCIFDIQAIDDLSWVTGSFAAMETSCTVAIYTNASSYKNTTDGSIELNTDVLLSLCPNDCSDHGNCSNATCICDEDYTAADCSIYLKGSPILFDIRKFGLCDRRRRPCRNVGIFGFPLLDSENLTCHIQEYKVIDSVWKPKNSVSLYPGIIMDLTEVKCFLPESPVNIGDYATGVTAAGLAIAVSNNRINASRESMLFITYDSLCQECNTTTGCKLKTDACFISGHCFGKNDSNPDDWCQQCFPKISTTSWLKRRNNKPPKLRISDSFYAFRGKEMRVQIKATDPENRTIWYSVLQNNTLGVSLSEEGLFSWIKMTNDSTTFTFKATDECGAYSAKNVTVMLKECLCKNSGECIPDKRYLDGAGNFTCSCPIEYTGVLCETDVNECNVSNPCFNGDCYNDQPGFSCSCFSGYTGDRCETEINECEPNPCFFGVNCTDMIASFRCGSCPTAYSGDGKNCSRIDQAENDQCVENPEICDVNANCDYNNGSYVCQCAKGFIGDGQNNCTDIDECNNKFLSVCHPLAICSNIIGSFLCQCIAGYSGDGIVTCADIDECAQSPPACHTNAHCNNSIGSYSCECFKGHFGDGKTNCTENKSPRFMTPHTIYAIIHKNFEIQIQAEDPEGDQIIYELLSNGTLETAAITENGLLTITDVKMNGTVYIQAVDKRGATNYVIIQVKAIQCPCKNNGTCAQKRAISYAVLPSDFYCQCKGPFTGNFCETRPNPCNQQPCYPGLRCSMARNSEGFSCEDCPPLFDGDGKYCELNRTEDISKNIVQSKMTLKDERWDNQLTVKTSEVYRDLVSRLTTEIRKIYINVPEFSYFIVRRFRRGSVIADFEVIFSSKVSDPLEPLLDAAKIGKLGNMTFELNGESDHEDTDDDTLNTKIMIIVIVLVVVFVLVITVVVCCVKRQRNYRQERLKKKDREVRPKNSNPCGISFQEKDGANGEEMDLKEFDNEAVRFDEDMNAAP